MNLICKMRIVLCVVVYFVLVNKAKSKTFLQEDDMRQENQPEKSFQVQKTQDTIAVGNMFMTDAHVGRSLSNISVKKLCNGKWIDPCKVCKLPRNFGFCRAYVIRYNFDSKSGSCKTMGYSGCLGNQNNFAKKQDCMDCCSGVLAQCE